MCFGFITAWIELRGLVVWGLWGAGGFGVQVQAEPGLTHTFASSGIKSWKLVF